MTTAHGLQFTIEELENALAPILRASFNRYGLICDDTSGSTVAALVQDIGPELADFLQSRGVAVDWSDLSRYGTHA